MNKIIDSGNSLDVNVRTEISCDKERITGISFKLEITTLEDEPKAGLTLSDIIRLRDALNIAIAQASRLQLPEQDMELIKNRI